MGGNQYLFNGLSIRIMFLLTKENMLFIGAPLNIEDGDGIPVRPVLLEYGK